MTAIAPHYTSDMFPNGLTLEDKITVFEDRVRGWQLNHAEYLLRTDPHSAFAALHIVVSYFESIAKFRDGFEQDGYSKKYFRKGFEWVFVEINTLIPDIVTREACLDKLYGRMRNALYHSGMTDVNFFVTADIRDVLEYENDIIHLNPHILVPKLNIHLSQYIISLRNPINTTQRENFENRFDWVPSHVKQK